MAQANEGQSEVKSFHQIREMVNSCGGGGLAGVNTDPPVVVRKKPKVLRRKIREKFDIQKYVAVASDPESPMKVNRKGKFAGMKLLQVSSGEYARISGNEQRPASREARLLDKRNPANKYARNWRYHHKGKPAAVQNWKTGELYLKPARGM